MTAGGEVELVNRQILEYFGKTTEELQNWATSNSFHPDDILPTINAWKRALETGHKALRGCRCIGRHDEMDWKLNGKRIPPEV
jgi:hypothetical protein